MNGVIKDSNKGIRVYKINNITGKISYLCFDTMPMAVIAASKKHEHFTLIAIEKDCCIDFPVMAMQEKIMKDLLRKGFIK